MSAVLDPAQAPALRAPDQMGQALLLAVLLHVLLVLVIGNAPGGSAKPGEGLWGPLNIRLQGDRDEPGSGEPAVVLPERGPIGEAKQQRFGGTVRDHPPTPEARKTPGAARQGQWQKQPGDELTGDAPAERQAPPAATSPAPIPSPTPAPPEPPVLSSPTPSPTPAPTPAQIPAPTPAPPAEVPAPTPAPLTMPSDSATVAPSRIAPARDTAPARSTVPADALQAPSSALQLPERPAPMLSETQTTVRRIDRAPVDRTQTLPPVPSELKAPTELPPLTAAPTPAPAPTAPPAPTAAPTPTPTPTPTQAPPAAVTASPTTTPSSTPQSRVAPTPSPTQAPANRVSLDGSTTPTTTQPSVGAPDAGSRVGHDVATPASTPPNAPKLNLDPRQSRGPTLPRGNAYGVIQAIPKPPVDKDALAEEMKKAGQQDCRKAYADKGLLAVVPLVRDAARDRGCRW
ncbi:hypothetical protein [Roseateles aquatilis]|uniref:hypothetical protein n=1 Tax=Roseateles aquatilis TaxID=431061 RepID=UPI001303992E|nr:hypothetical protein [Roseateles aquatilis]